MAEPALDLRQIIDEIAALAQTGQRDQARKLVGQTLKQYPNSAEAWFVAHLTVDQADHQIKVLQRALSLDPGHAAARHVLERLLASTSSVGEAPAPEPEVLPAPLVSDRTMLFLELGAIIVLILSIVGVLMASDMRQRQLDAAAGSAAATLAASVSTAPDNQLAASPQPMLLATATYPPVPPPEIDGSVIPLPIDVVDAKYSLSLDKLIVLAADSSALYIVNPRSPTSRPVDLYGPPNSLTLAPDGLHAAVGHEKAISYVNLQTGKLENIFLTDVTPTDITIGSNGWLYYAPINKNNDAPLTFVQTQTGEQIPTTYTYPLAHILLHPDNSRMYFMGPRVYRLDVGEDGMVEQTDKNSEKPSCDKVWFVENATLLVTACSDVFKLSKDSSSDLAYYGQLEGTYKLEEITWGAGRILGISKGSSVVYIWDASSLSLLKTLLLPRVEKGTPVTADYIFATGDQRGYFVIMHSAGGHSSDGSVLPSLLVHGDLFPPNSLSAP
jgi:hypothetical protein